MLNRFLKIADDLALAVENIPEEKSRSDLIKNLIDGLNMIQNQFVQSFDAMGVSEVNAVGQEFDPNLHEAVVEQFSEEIEAGKVISQQRSGYKMGEKLIRAAPVVVSTGPEPEAEEETEEVAEES